MKLILASGSPRRREILSIAGYDYEVVPSAAEEITGGFCGADLAKMNASAKAKEVFSRLGGGDIVVLGADTVVCLGGEILGKPKDASDAKRMLRKLSGSSHSVITGYSVIGKECEKSGYCETLVKFREITEAEIDSYTATGEPLDKAGAYGIQERGGLFAKAVEGDFFNIIGLPAAAIYPVLAEFGITPEWVDLP